jgi:hypothetical protein
MVSMPALTEPWSAVITLSGKVRVKKNAYTPRKDGKGFYKGSKLKGELDALAIQIPSWARDKQLRHPNITFQFHLPSGNSDRDGMVTTLLDVMVSFGIIHNDSVASCNGTITIPPAKYSDEPFTEITLTLQSEDLWPAPEKQRRLKR